MKTISPPVFITIGESYILRILEITKPLHQQLDGTILNGRFTLHLVGQPQHDSTGQTSGNYSVSIENSYTITMELMETNNTPSSTSSTTLAI